jgi:hypothetical protein
MLRHSLVSGTGDSRLALYLGRGDCLHQDGEPGISPGRLQTIPISIVATLATFAAVQEGHYIGKY